MQLEQLALNITHKVRQTGAETQHCHDPWKIDAHPPAMFPLIFQSLHGHKISFVQHFTRTRLYLERRVSNMCQKHFWKEHLCVLQVFLCALISRLVCVRTCTHLRGNITPRQHKTWAFKWAKH